MTGLSRELAWRKSQDWKTFCGEWLLVDYFGGTGSVSHNAEYSRKVKGDLQLVDGTTVRLDSVIGNWDWCR